MNKSYDITGSDALSYSQAAEILSSEAGKKISYVDVTEEDARKGMKQMGADDWFIDVMLELFRITRAGYGSQTTTAVEHIIGRKPIPLHNLQRIMLKFSYKIGSRSKIGLPFLE